MEFLIQIIRIRNHEKLGTDRSFPWFCSNWSLDLQITNFSKSSEAFEQQLNTIKKLRKQKQCSENTFVQSQKTYSDTWCAIFDVLSILKGFLFADRSVFAVGECFWEWKTCNPTHGLATKKIRDPYFENRRWDKSPDVSFIEIYDPKK